MKNLTVYLVILSLVLALFSGCAAKEATVEEPAAEVTETVTETSEAPEAEAPEAEEPAQEDAAEAEEPVEAEPAEPQWPVELSLPLTEETTTLTFWYSAFPNWDFDTVFGQNPAIARAEELTGVHAEVNFVVMDAFAEKFNLMIVSGEYPDFISSGAYVGGCAQAFEDEVIIDITEEVETLAPNYMALISKDEVTLKSAYDDESRILGFATISKDAALPTDGLIIRQDWLDDLGLDSPVTYSDYEDVMQAFIDAYGITEPFAINSTGIEQGLLVGYGTTMGFYVVDGQVTSGYIAPEMKEYVEMANRWYQKGYISSEFTTNPESRPDESTILSNNTGLWMNGYQLSDYEKKASDPNYKLAGSLLPVRNEGDIIHTDYRPSTLDGNMRFCVTSCCEDVELAVKWMDFWFSEDGYYLSNYGVEGLTYDMVDGKPVMTELMTNNPDGLDVRATVMYFTVQYNIPYYKDANNLNTAYTETEMNARVIWASNQDGAYVIPSAAALNTDEAAAYALHITDIETYADENILRFILGERSLDEWDEYVSVYYDLGIQDCIDAYQTCYDRFMSR